MKKHCWFGQKNIIYVINFFIYKEPAVSKLGEPPPNNKITPSMFL